MIYNESPHQYNVSANDGRLRKPLPRYPVHVVMRVIPAGGRCLRQAAAHRTTPPGLLVHDSLQDPRSCQVFLNSITDSRLSQASTPPPRALTHQCIPY